MSGVRTNTNHILPHFSLEEKHLFPILGNDHPLVVDALEQHRYIEKIFEETESDKSNLKRLEEALESHVRFEERILFNEIQQKGELEALKLVEKMHDETPFLENRDDEFWL